MEMVELMANARQHTGKKGAKECRNNGLLPGILYGKQNESVPLAVDPKALDGVLHTHAGSNVIIKLSIEEKGGDPVNVVVKELQVDSIRGTMRHVDFCQISLDRKIRTAVPLRIIGEAPGVKEGGILEHILWELEVESLPLDIPDFIEVDVSELDIGDALAVSKLSVPEGVSIMSDWDAAVVSVAAPRVEEEVVEEVPEAEVEGEEPQIISGKPEKEAKEADQKTEGKEAEGEKKPDEKRKSKE